MSESDITVVIPVQHLIDMGFDPEKIKALDSPEAIAGVVYRAQIGGEITQNLISRTQQLTEQVSKQVQAMSTVCREDKGLSKESFGLLRKAIHGKSVFS